MLINIFYSPIPPFDKFFHFYFVSSVRGPNEWWVHKTLDEHLIDTKVVVRYGFKKGICHSPQTLFTFVHTKDHSGGISNVYKYKWNNEKKY